jgi:2-polyprenyl-3-methyl-5-hydroxy-6-metoxy-1,4-benzoquinol methylase
MGEPASWQRRVEEFVLGQIGDPPARVLEVGCGEGELARAPARVWPLRDCDRPAGARRSHLRRERIEEFSDPGQFDYLVTSLSLHHVEDLGRVLVKIADLLRAGGL